MPRGLQSKMWTRIVPAPGPQASTRDTRPADPFDGDVPNRLLELNHVNADGA